MRVVTGVFFHPLGERAARPIGFLRTLVQFHAEKFFDERTQAELPFTQKPRREHRVENCRRNEFVVLPQQTQIVIRPVHDEFVGIERVEQRVQIDFGKRVNQFVAGDGADLNETDFFGIGVQAVGLGIEREPGCGFDCRQECGEFCVGVNHVRIFYHKGAKTQSF